MRRGRVWLSARNWMQSVKCHPQTLALTRPCLIREFIERSLAPMFGRNLSRQR